jgi:hypothetical protein
VERTARPEGQSGIRDVADDGAPEADVAVRLALEIAVQARPHRVVGGRRLVVEDLA